MFVSFQPVRPVAAPAAAAEGMVGFQGDDAHVRTHEPQILKLPPRDPEPEP